MDLYALARAFVDMLAQQLAQRAAGQPTTLDSALPLLLEPPALPEQLVRGFEADPQAHSEELLAHIYRRLIENPAMMMQIAEALSAHHAQQAAAPAYSGTRSVDAAGDEPEELAMPVQQRIVQDATPSSRFGGMTVGSEMTTLSVDIKQLPQLTPPPAPDAASIADDDLKLLAGL